MFYWRLLGIWIGNIKNIGLYFLGTLMRSCIDTKVSYEVLDSLLESGMFEPTTVRVSVVLVWAILTVTEDAV